MRNKRKLFVSYSHKDEIWLERIMPYLFALQRKAQVVPWSDKDIYPSQQWEAEIDKALMQADAAILLLSQDFLVSEYINAVELPVLLRAVKKRGLRIFPIVVSSFFIEDSPILDFQSVNYDRPLDRMPKSEQNHTLSNLVRSISKVLSIHTAGISEDWLTRFRSNFLPVSGGEFMSGDDRLFENAHALRRKKARVSSFYISKYVITQSEWQAVVRSQPWLNESNVKYGADLPAVHVSWQDAQRFIRTLNRFDTRFIYRLPTELEWEYAARGGKDLASSNTLFCFGDRIELLSNYGWYDQNTSLVGINYAQPVGMLEPNQLGLFDMHGNVWEWLSDDRDGLRPLRGGGFNFKALGACSAFRVENKPEMSGEATGFRLIREKRS
ncbi:MAG: SUMF1/EgtB/PvdO family nonheme iron enzyme [Bacteroidota bacterium]